MTDPSAAQTRCILAVFAHPDDETTAAGALMALAVEHGIDVHVITATRGELGTLGTGGMSLERHELPAVREDELRTVLKLYGVPNPPVFLDYRDQELPHADFEEVAGKISAVMHRVRPDVVITFGPTGISNHPDHLTIHELAVTCFGRYRDVTGEDPALLYVAIPKDVADAYGLEIEGPEVEPNVFISVDGHWPLKVQALRLYQSQEDAQELAAFLEGRERFEMFHQVHPELPVGVTRDSLW